MKGSFVFFIIMLFCVSFSVAQSYNQEKTAMTNYLIRMYESFPFEGVRAVDDYEHQYLITVFSLENAKYASESDMNRVANVKAMSLTSRFFNGSFITSEMIIHTSDKSDGSADSEIIETIKENHIGYARLLEQLANFPYESGLRTVFIYHTLIQ